jgi:hypothetical protein
MTQQRVLAFIAESILDVYHIIEHVEKNTRIDASGTFISNEIYQLPQRQIELRNRLNIPLYGT